MARRLSRVGRRPRDGKLWFRSELALLKGVSVGSAALMVSPAHAATVPDRPGTGVVVQASADTYVHLFQRASLPGAYGAEVEGQTFAPVYQYLTVRAQGADAPWKEHSVDTEVSAWGSVQLADSEPLGRFDGDVTTAHVTQRFEPAYVRLGRQAWSAGAARFVRFDGIRANLHLGGASLDAYGGFTVLPRWNEQPGYYRLGSSLESLLRSPEGIVNPERSGYWMQGVRAAYRNDWLLGALSFHDEHESSEVARRAFGAELQLQPRAGYRLTGHAIVDSETRKLAQGRAWFDFAPWRALAIDVEYLRTRSNLYLSRQSVLSVFGANAFDETGGQVNYRPVRHLTATGAAYVEWFGQGASGVRGELGVKALVDRDQRLSLEANYGRVVAVENGYHSLRSTLSYWVSSSVGVLAGAYWYRYEEPIAQRRYSAVYLGNLTWRPLRALSLLWGTSFSETPYAKADLQTLVRLSYQDARSEP